MARLKLTALTVDRLQPPATGRAEYFDATLPGFGLRVTDNGIKTWIVMYRAHGRQRRLTLGRYPALTLADAREDARAALRDVARGLDPADERLARKRQTGTTMRELIEQFVEQHAKRHTRRWKDTERLFKVNVLPALGHRDIRSVTRHDVLNIIEGIVERDAPVMANQVLAAVRKFFNWCRERDIIAVSPASGVRPPTKVQSRDRVLTDDEVVAIWRACDGIGWPFGPMVRLMLLTAQRRGEVAGMRWTDIDMGRAVWELPASATKAGRSHRVPLSAEALAVLQRQPRYATTATVFTTNGRTAASGFSKAKARLDKLSGVKGWRLHDLRRTAASGMARAGVPMDIISRVLNHAPAGVSAVTAVYNRYGYEAEKGAALREWSASVSRITTDARRSPSRPTAEVA